MLILSKNDLIPSSCDVRGHVKLFYNARETKAVLLINWNKSYPDL